MCCLWMRFTSGTAGLLHIVIYSYVSTALDIGLNLFLNNDIKIGNLLVGMLYFNECNYKTGIIL